MSNNKGYRGLGRGLETLLSTPRTETSNLSPLENAPNAKNSLPISALQSGRFQPRTHFNEEHINALAESIRAQGVVQPIIVRKLNDELAGGKEYEIIAGERRWRAAQKAGLINVPVVIRNDIDDQQSMAIALIENIQREDLNVIEEAEGLLRLNKEFGLTHDEIARIVGRSRSAITNSLRLLDLNPKVQEMVRDDKLKMGHVRALLPLASEQQFSVAEQVFNQKLTTREVEKLVNDSVSSEGSSGEAITKNIQISNEQKLLVKSLQHQLTQLLNKPVKVNYRASGQGNINISFIEISEVEALIQKFKN